MPIACDQRKIETSTTKPKKESRQSEFSPRLYFDVEHMMGKLKVFVILCRCYQNRCQRLSLRFNSRASYTASLTSRAFGLERADLMMPNESKQPVTLRSVLIGRVFVVLLCAMTPYNNDYLQHARTAGNLSAIDPG